MNQDKFSKYSDYLISGAQKVVLDIAKLIVDLNKKIIKNPSNIIFERKIYEKKVEKIINNFDKEWQYWADEDLAKAYIAGIKEAEKLILASGNKPNKSGEISGKLLLRDFAPPPGIPEIPGQVSMLFSSAGYANHETFFGVFRQSAYYSLEGQHVQLMRAANDIYRDIAVMAGESHYSEADIFTRRKFSQSMLDEFSRKGIQSITYKNGAKYSIDTYCEMMGRTLTGRCALQANINRMMESGYYLGIVSSHFRACDLCTPYEGVTLSMDGKSNEYESIWDAELQGLFHPNCYSNDTEVYTSNGWKLFKDVEPLDKIFSLNPNSHIPEMIEWKEKFNYFENEMIEFKSNSFDLLVTKNHNMYIGINSHTENKKKIIKWKIETAENCLTKNFRQLRCVNWEGLDLEYDTFGYTKKDFAFFLGIYMSEGSTDKNRSGKLGRVVISQYKESGINEIEKRLIPMGFYFSGNRFVKDNIKLANYLKQFGYSYEKYIPDFILNEKPEIIREFLNAFLIGDGSIRKNKSKLKNIESFERVYFTSSKKLADQLGECILKIGKYPSFTLQKTKGKLQKFKNGEYVCNHDIWRIHENNSKMSYHNISKTTKHRGIQSEIVDNYNDFVYCLELEKYHIMLVRRNGKVAWSGNCLHDVSPFFESVGAITPSVDPAEQELIDQYGYNEAQKMSYAAQQKQRYIERNIRNWKRREVVSLDSNAKDYSSKKIREWQAKQRDHLNNNTYLRRKYEREQIKNAY